MTRATLVSALLVPFFTLETAFARLDYIDAAGVTEKGGAGYARMLPRTGADGRLDASLLPPVGDYATDPIPNLLYVSSAVAEEGNGSSARPFKTLQAALDACPAGGAVVCAPGVYSGTLTIPAGEVRTLLGCGFETVFSALTVSAGGESDVTTLRICGAKVNSVTVSGAKLAVSLLGARIGTLDGGVSALTVTREDLGSTVLTPLITYSDSFSGFRRVPESEKLVSSSGSDSLILSEGHGWVNSARLATVSEVEAVTNGLGATISALHAADAALGELVEVETGAREGADTALAGAIRDAATSSTNYTDALRTYWGTQLSTLQGGLVSVNGTVSTLDTREAGHYSTLSARLDDVPSSGSISALRTELLGEIGTQVGNLSDQVPELSRPTAQGEITAATPTIVASAVAEAKTEAQALVNPVAGRVGTLETWKSDADGHLTSLKNAVNAIIDALKKVKAGQTLTDDDIPAYVSW